MHGRRPGRISVGDAKLHLVTVASETVVLVFEDHGCVFVGEQRLDVAEHAACRPAETNKSRLTPIPGDIVLNPTENMLRFRRVVQLVSVLRIFRLGVCLPTHNTV